VQIGGGVHVGGAFQAFDGFDPIAIWGGWLCVSKFLDGAFVPRWLKTREIRTEPPETASKVKYVGALKATGVREAA
jgi:hypothetical protein